MNISVYYLNSGNIEKRQEFFKMFTKDSKRLTGGSKVFRDFMREVDNSINLNPTGQSA